MQAVTLKVAKRDLPRLIEQVIADAGVHQARRHGTRLTDHAGKHLSVDSVATVVLETGCHRFKIPACQPPHDLGEHQGPVTDRVGQ